MTVTLALIVKEPTSGRAKTRLAATLGARQARDLAEAMLLDSVEALDRATSRVPRLVLYHDPPDAAARLRSLGVPERFVMVPQVDGTLGHRLAHLAGAELGSGASACVIAAADSPFALVPAILDCIPRTRDEVVLAPCEDGGYWAVGLARTAPIFDVPMGTADVIDATVSSARAAGRPVRLLPATLDIDVESDLERAARSGLLGGAPRTAAAWAGIVRLSRRPEHARAR